MRNKKEPPYRKNRLHGIIYEADTLVGKWSDIALQTVRGNTHACPNCWFENNKDYADYRYNFGRNL